jgi:hypothetical protein
MFKARGTSGVLTALVSLGVALALALPLTGLVHAAPASSATITSGTGQSAAVNSRLASPFVITAVDAEGNAMSDVTVNWVFVDRPANSVGAALIDAETQTDADGRAQVFLQLGDLPGIYSVKAVVEGIESALILFEATATANITGTPVITSPSNGSMLTHLGTELHWTNPVGATQYEIRVTPFNDDGPAIHLVRDIEDSYTILEPDFDNGNYVMLPGMTYTWDVRVTNSTSSDPIESEWSARASGSFRTPSVTSDTISMTTGMNGSVMSMMPTLTWTNSNDEVFYYEIQLSADANFSTSLGSPALYHELVHGGMSNPLNSYTVRPQFVLKADTDYYWRVRPRIQGDGTPVDWSSTARFHTSSALQ